MTVPAGSCFACLADTTTTATSGRVCWKSCQLPPTLLWLASTAIATACCSSCLAWSISRSLLAAAAAAPAGCCPCCSRNSMAGGTTAWPGPLPLPAAAALLPNTSALAAAGVMLLLRLPPCLARLQPRWLPIPPAGINCCCCCCCCCRCCKLPSSASSGGCKCPVQAAHMTQHASTFWVDTYWKRPILIKTPCSWASCGG